MDTNSTHLPRYIQFANKLRQLIDAGEFATGDRLPSQRALAAQLGTTLMTVRKALRILEEAGHIRIEHGNGTFVTSPELDEDQFQLLSMSREMKQQTAVITETKLRDVLPHATHETAVQALQLPVESTVCLLERVRYMDGHPFGYQRSYLPPTFARQIHQYEPTQSLYAWLRLQTGTAVTLAKEVWQPILLTAKQAAVLNSDSGTCAWLSRRISATQDGTPLLYDEAILKQDKFVITIEHVGRRTNCQLNMLHAQSPNMLAYLMEE